ncbi:hypothetical protein EPUS_02729 [Endocarpon pusillum Z07020]|uniref:SUN domain-containing protein n=1 Tax=Endocarpon pusillum (strain Z07020 / HMAS-L-300199) TaxID=1263415 RepID=U1G8F2_ENDPU|nr:uncharacterized protein EPUS_02729 [Endocarpon pusillum Z07020]ERF68273.1 hypothetical protein EPUS_02729 [Endocarpon pusillum Z07020]
MPPRRTTRAATSTPTRTLPAATRPLNHGNTPGRTATLETTPLPDVEAELSFAYGSSNTKPLPLQLVAHKKQSHQQILEIVDIGVVEANKNFAAQAVEAEQYGTTTAVARAARAARRSSERESRASSVEEDQTPVPQISRRRKGFSTEKTNQWLDDIEEEADSQERAGTQDDAGSQRVSYVQAKAGTQGGQNAQEEAGSQGDLKSRDDSSLSNNSHRSLDRDTESSPPETQRGQSTMPDLNHWDHTYTQERGLHSQGTTQPPTDAWSRFLCYVTDVRDFFLLRWNRIWWYFHDYSFEKFRTHCYELAFMGCILFLIFAGALFMTTVFCWWFCETPWSLSPSGSWHHRVNGMCRYTAMDWRSRDTTADATSTGTSASQISRLMKQIKRQEELVHDLQAKQSVTSATVDELTERQAELLKYQSELQGKLAKAEAAQAASSSRSSKSPWQSPYLAPIFKRINYASPGLGAVIDPYLTSPTKAKHFPFYQRLLLDSAGIKKYQSRPPIQALTPWTEIGDCWCAALTESPNHPTSKSKIQMDGRNGRYVQLAIMLGYDIFPDEIVIEHLPIKTTPFPGIAPKDIEIWADFGHLSHKEFASLTAGPRGLKEVELYPPMGLLGTFQYDAVANEKEGRYVQVFRLEYNQNQHDEFWTKKLVVRVKRNWGGENTCLYRVRVHGVPVHPHPELVAEDD